MSQPFDIAVVGAGVIGLAHAYEAAQRGLTVALIERDSRALGASIRNFGFITVTGQARGDMWRKARRSRDVWACVAPEAGVPIEHRGLILTLRHPESIALAEAFLATEMGEGCQLLTRAEAEARLAGASPSLLGALASPHEIRVESRTAIPALTRHLVERGVSLFAGHAALRVSGDGVETARGPIRARRTVVCPGDDYATLFPDRIARYSVSRTRLSMLRLADPGSRLPAAVMSDLGLVRYAGYAALPEAAALRSRLDAEQAEHLAHGVHLICVQSGDGTLVVGDSHHDDEAPEPFAAARTEALILDEYARALGRTAPPVVERWTGVYAIAPGRSYIIDAPEPNVRLVLMTSGAGASIAFGLAETVLDDLVGAAVAA